MNLPDVHIAAARWVLLIRFCVTFIGGVFSMLLLATGLIDISKTYFPASMTLYINSKSALVITIGVWYLLWNLYLGPEIEGDEVASLSDLLFLPLCLLLMLFLATSGLQLQILESGIRTLPSDYQLIEALDRLYPWVMAFFLVISASYGAKQDYRRQLQSKNNERRN